MAPQHPYVEALCTQRSCALSENSSKGMGPPGEEEEDEAFQILGL